MIYTVEYFNPLGNCDNVVHVEATNEFEAALIAHADFWVKDKKFNFGDYCVSEYDPEYVITKESIFNKTHTTWDEYTFNKTLTKCQHDWLKDEWKYGYAKVENGIKELISYFKSKSGIELDEKGLKEILKK